MMQWILGLSLLTQLSFAETFSVIAHRGAPRYVPEHSIEGLVMSHSWGVDFWEPDLVLSKDNVPIVLHDLYLDTTTDIATRKEFANRKRQDGRWYAIDLTLKEIKTLRLHERIDRHSGKRVYPKRFDPKVGNFKIPTFEEAVTILQQLNRTTQRTVGIYPEIKHAKFHEQHKKDIVKIVYEQIRDLGYENKPHEIFIQSFEASTLIRIKEEFKSPIPLVQLFGDFNSKYFPGYRQMLSEKGLRKVRSYATAVGVWIENLRDETGKDIHPVIKRMQKLNFKTHVYTIRDDALPSWSTDLKQLMRWLIRDVKVDGVFTDTADKVLKTLLTQGQAV